MIQFLKKLRRVVLVKIKSPFISLNFYTASPQNLLMRGNENKFLIVKSKAEYCKLMEIETPNDYIVQRLEQFDEFVCIKGTKGYLSRGWVTHSRIFFDYDTQQNILNDKYCILYDFETPDIHRKNGYYTTLLKSIHNYYPSKKEFLIFANQKNIASNKAIIRAGFNKNNKIQKGIIING